MVLTLCFYFIFIPTIFFFNFSLLKLQKIRVLCLQLSTVLHFLFLQCTVTVNHSWYLHSCSILLNLFSLLICLCIKFMTLYLLLLQLSLKSNHQYSQTFCIVCFSLYLFYLVKIPYYYRFLCIDPFGSSLLTTIHSSFTVNTLNFFPFKMTKNSSAVLSPLHFRSQTDCLHLFFKYFLILSFFSN